MGNLQKNDDESLTVETKFTIPSTQLHFSSLNVKKKFSSCSCFK